MLFHMIKAIIFDFDGVIAESVDIKTEAFAELYKYYGDEVVKKAIKHQEDAVELADKMQTWHKKRHRNFLDEYKNKSHDLEE